MEENHQHSFSPDLILLQQFVEVIKKSEKNNNYATTFRTRRNHVCVFACVCVCIAVCMLSLCLQIIVSLTYALEWQLGK